MDEATMEKEMMVISKSMRKNLENYVDSFLGWLITYSDPDDEFIVKMKASKEEQEHFINDLRKAASYPEPQKQVIQKLVVKSRVPTAEEMFTKVVNKSFQGWSSGKLGVVPEGFVKHEQLEDIKKKRKRGKKDA